MGNRSIEIAYVIANVRTISRENGETGFKSDWDRSLMKRAYGTNTLLCKLGLLGAPVRTGLI
jgi:hypothetical protein